MLDRFIELSVQGNGTLSKNSNESESTINNGEEKILLYWLI
ncbi:MAG: hypothetical protein Q7I96_05680 [Methanobacteriaceae archaeon]|nr:hypothetical protein [Methanobacteriaceae archaeon]